jgi:hypothetical protein
LIRSAELAYQAFLAQFVAQLPDALALVTLTGDRVEELDVPSALVRDSEY